MRVCVCGVGSVTLALFVNNCFIILLVESLGKRLAKISSVFVSEDDASVENVKKEGTSYDEHEHNTMEI